MNTENGVKEEASAPEETISKQTFRMQVWDHLEKNNLANFPRPVYNRIPNIVGADAAASKLQELPEYKDVQCVEVNPDKAQEIVRRVILEDKKKLYVPVPRLKDGFLKHIAVPESSPKSVIVKAVNRKGLEFKGTIINVTDKVQIDMLIIGSVAVSKNGYRIGKGKGYADLEYAILLEMGAITENTLIITTVHDCQVFDTLPEEIFKEYDVPIDYIVTPTQVIKVENRLPRPKGIYWHLLSQRRLNLMPVLQTLKELHESKGKDTTLKEVDSDNEFYEKTKFVKFRGSRLRPRSQGKQSQGEDTNNENVPPENKIKHAFRKHKSSKSDNKSTENGGAAVDHQNKALKKFKRPFHKKKPHIDFSLMVSNIEKSVRVRDLKNALSENGIKPSEITWRGYKGVCYLHYSKTNNLPKVENEQPSVGNVDNVIEILQNMKITPTSNPNLSVKVMDPISRIETTDVTAV